MKPPTAAPAKYPCAIMCCGCRSLLGSDGKPVALDLGFVDITQVACFSDGAAADAFAAKHGWQIADKDGPNHRCPDCLKEAARSEKRGCYIPWPPA